MRKWRAGRAACCDAHQIEPPEVNALVAGHVVDALFRAARLVVELDATVADLRGELRNWYAAIRVTHPDEIGGVS